MFKKLILVYLFLHVLAVSAHPSTEKHLPNWFFHIGEEAAKDVTPKLNIQTPKNGKEISLPKSELLSAAECSTEKQPDCSKKQSSCGLPLVDLGGRSYYFGTYFKANFFKAMQFCRDHEMNLLSIESDDENMRILYYLANYVKGIDHLWTSGSDAGDEGKFVWLATGKYFNYTHWSPPEPDNADNNEDCLELTKQSDIYVWNDATCTNELYFICEMKECTNFCY